MWVRKKFDIGWTDLAVGMLTGAIPGRRERRLRLVESVWPDEDRTFACFSVRSGFDLLFQSLELEAGSEVIFSALTVPDMPRIAVHHGLKPVPVDIDLDTLEPDLDQLRRAITPKTKMVVVAHLFGTRIPMGPIIEIAREHGLIVVEDCAQVYDAGRYLGHDDSDVVMFSFGVIKTATALGGGVFRVRRPEVLSKMREIQSQYPTQGEFKYFYKLVRYSVFKGLSWYPLLAMIVAGYRILGLPYDKIFNGLAKGFPGPDFFDRIRTQPSSGLLKVMNRRLRTYNKRLLQRRRNNALEMTELIGEHVQLPGSKAPDHSHWVFPVYVDDPKRLLALLARAGFDATQGDSMAVVEPPEDRSDLAAMNSQNALQKMVFLPLYAAMSGRGIRRMARVLLDQYPMAEEKESA